MLRPLKMIVKSINMTVKKEEDPESGFSREKFLRAIEASEVKLNQEIQFRQEREAKINSASKPVANRAFDEKKLMNKTKSGGWFSKSKESDMESYFAYRMANHRKSKGSSFPHVNFKAKAESNLRRNTPNPPRSKTPLVDDIKKRIKN
jgi:hypothetical protein